VTEDLSPTLEGAPTTRTIPLYGDTEDSENHLKKVKGSNEENKGLHTSEVTMSTTIIASVNRDINWCNSSE
jgi:hypothetical protein